MDPNRNPFNPGAGVMPPELAGRYDALEGAILTLNRIRRGRYERSFVYTGLRGVGKTVLLREIRNKARAMGYQANMLEARDGQRLADLLIPAIRSALLEIDRASRTVEAVKRSLRVLRSFMGSIEIDAGAISVSLDVDPEPGKADSGNLEQDIADLLLSVGEAAKAAGKPVSILIDEMQYLAKEDLASLFRGIHAVNQEELPLVFFGAGLPQLAGQSGEAKSYAERLFEFIPLDHLSEEDTYAAIRGPVESELATITDEALAEVFTHTRGYPYFLQEWGYNAWNLADFDGITLDAARRATARSIAKLDGSFFRVRFDRLTPSEREYMRHLADLGEGPQRTSDVAARAQKTVRSLGTIRDSLIKKGMIFSPEHGLVAFTVPLFDAFMHRVMPG
ncbi:ATP-binding protein [Pinirhizobacter sp.]|uniref:ATP-binding protein n=1 Tax=Pinirhizobacter sp. TaxID=2950432 RepID=UPI002F3FA9DD